jgi:hypothetical protein
MVLAMADTVTAAMEATGAAAVISRSKAEHP